MTANTGFTGIGAALKMGDGASPETFTAIGNTTGFSLESTAEEIDATHLLSTNGRKEYKQGYKDLLISGQSSWDPDNATHNDATGIMAAYEAGTIKNFKADFSAADNGGSGAPSTDPVGSFSGVFTRANISVSSGMVTIDYTIRPTGAITWGAS